MTFMFAHDNTIYMYVIGSVRVRSSGYSAPEQLIMIAIMIKELYKVFVIQVAAQYYMNDKYLNSL